MHRPLPNFYIKAKYHQNVPKTPGAEEAINLAKNSIFLIQVAQLSKGRIQVVPANPVTGQSIVDASLLYQNLYAFFKDWEPIGVIGLSPTQSDDDIKSKAERSIE